MCGINGILSSRINKDLIQERIISMNSALSHRGPDDEGVFFHEGEAYSLSL